MGRSTQHCSNTILQTDPKIIVIDESWTLDEGSGSGNIEWEIIVKNNNDNN